jgi:hypothetical protein
LPSRRALLDCIAPPPNLQANRRSDVSDEPKSSESAERGAEVASSTSAEPTQSLVRKSGRQESTENPRGLSAVERSRAERRKFPRPPWKAAAWFGLVVSVALGLYGYRASSELDGERQVLLSKQRATRAELEPLWSALRSKVEGSAKDLATAPNEELFERDELSRFPFQQLPGIYLRVRQGDADSPEKLQSAALTASKDAFTACLMRTAGESPIAGAECTRTSDCPSGQLCNELDRCARPAQPYNLRLAYRALFVIEEAWAEEVRTTRSDLTLSALSGTFDDVMRSEIPIAIELLSKAQFVLLVIDELPERSDEAPDAGPSAEDRDMLAGKTWFSRVGLYRLSDGKPLVRMRREVKGQLLGGSRAADPQVEAARLRQARSCALALELRQSVEGAPAPPPSTPPPSTPPPSTPPPGTAEPVTLPAPASSAPSAP